MKTARLSNQSMFLRFLHSQVFGSLILIATTVVALIWANSRFGADYHELSHLYVGISAGDWSFELTLSHWIKDGLMAIFFFVVGLEIKREMVVGELSSIDKAMLPVSAALGGAIVPAALYWLFNQQGDPAMGWGIPMATDIAFALGVLSMFGSRVPIGLKVFLTALAIADDLLAVAVIAAFYTPTLDIGTLLLAAIPMIAMIIFNRARVRAVWVYVLLALFVWVSVLGSGVHATIAGVMVAMVIPVRPVIDTAEFLKLSGNLLSALQGPDNSLEALIHDAGRREKLEQLELTVEDAIPPAIKLEHSLHPLQSFIILPLFALFSAGVTFNAETLSGFPTGVSLGVMIGLVVGKPVGVLIACLLVLKFSSVELNGVTVSQLLGAGCLAGIGFTMSIFISELAWADQALIDQAKLGILLASVLAGIIGCVALHLTLPPRTHSAA